MHLVFHLSNHGFDRLWVLLGSIRSLTLVEAARSRVVLTLRCLWSVGKIGTATCWSISVVLPDGEIVTIVALIGRLVLRLLQSRFG